MKITGPKMPTFKVLLLFLLVSATEPCIFCWKDIAANFDRDVTLFLEANWPVPLLKDTLSMTHNIFLSERAEVKNKAINYIDREQMERETGALLKEIHKVIPALMAEMDRDQAIAKERLIRLRNDYLDKLKSRSTDLTKEGACIVLHVMMFLLRCTGKGQRGALRPV
ncbi:hypothetical protein NDU88_009481 [Pleurodeles waltl]|uniref:Uncharacterized protein n=1 Tax=Pleurodeles waltl TaxID=8319 RepID=A0AAV7PSB8_PLEWA|nr:hypothetical protein NDU88_009481 [Pleurodeles waltl]